ncbi:MAG: cytochrome c oxidase subunit II [Proteobacteria bacterium]|nr:cytochrome c oxidase subunit II [Pseudomonadota bacterium]
MPVGVTEISRKIYGLHMDIFMVCVVVGCIVFGAMAISIFLHRKSRGAVPATFHESTTLEIVWTLLPAIILVVMAVPATGVLVDIYDAGGEDMVVEIRGYQWKWQYKYLDDDYNRNFDFFSNMSTTQDEIHNVSVKDQNYLLDVDKPLVIPVNRKVRFLLTSEDVIHAWWVPDFGIKRDAVPGMVNELWTIVDQSGTYRGQCTELCGKDHGFMPVVVKVLPQDGYDAWYAAQVKTERARREALSKTFTADELMAEGQRVYDTFCVACHQANGKGLPPAFPGLAGSQVALGPVDAHIRMVYEGVPGTSMQAFGKQLDAAELAAVVHFERHSWGNNTDDVTQPKDVIALMEGQ